MAARFLNSIMDILKDNLIGDERVSKESTLYYIFMHVVRILHFFVVIHFFSEIRMGGDLFNYRPKPRYCKRR